MNCNFIREIKEQVERELTVKGKKVVRVTVPTELLICENERGAQEVKARSQGGDFLRVARSA
ncbi:hypothetical protein C1N53_22600 (plasmid) [Pontibacter sp. SGAir0037]|nr:hypothetical protein C1N53_22600 [Pontibacter sp. SGAir0037]